MHKSRFIPFVRLLLAVLALFAFGAVSLHAEDVFVTAYTGSDINVNPPFNYGTGISGFGTSSVGSASPAPPARTRAMFGFQLGTNAWVTTQPTLGSMGAGVAYRVYILRGTDGNASPDVVVKVTADGGTLLNTNGAPQTTIITKAFQAGSGAVNNWLWVGSITNLTTTTPTILWAYDSGTQSATGGRCYFDAFRFYYSNICASVTQVGITGAVAADQTVVSVSGVVSGATNVTVLANGAQIGTTNYAAGFAAGTIAVPTSPLVKDTVLTAQQSKIGCTQSSPSGWPGGRRRSQPKDSSFAGLLEERLLDRSDRHQRPFQLHQQLFRQSLQLD